jgi:nucleoside-diphosphate-sugar epimerase
VRVFLAGATGVIGVRLLPLLVEAGHVVAGMTRSPERADGLRAAGAEPVVCDVFDAEALRAAVVDFGPEAVMHQLTDLPDDAAQVSEWGPRNMRMRREGTSNLIEAARAAGAGRFVAQSVAWELPGERHVAVADMERMVFDYGGVIVRYGQLYGPGTYWEDEKPEPPRVDVDEAARRTVPTLDAEPGSVVEIVDSA